jgi:hypothetical protein
MGIRCDVGPGFHDEDCAKSDGAASSLRSLPIFIGISARVTSVGRARPGDSVQTGSKFKVLKRLACSLWLVTRSSRLFHLVLSCQTGLPD